MKIGVVVAMPQEFNTLTTKSTNYQEPIHINQGFCGIISGMGASNAAQAVKRLCSYDPGIQGVISWGVAAALSHRLMLGQATMPHSIITTGGKTHKLAGDLNSYLHHKISRKLTVETDLLHAVTSDVLASVKDKVALHSRTKAHSADMESGALLRYCNQQQMDFAVIRVISDDAETSIPEIISKSSTTDGRVNMVKLLGLLLRHPTQLPQMIQVARDFGKAKQELSKISKLIKSE